LPSSFFIRDSQNSALVPNRSMIPYKSRESGLIV
jgi:hypothetical protein